MSTTPKTDLEHAQELAASLMVILFDLHPTFGSTAKWFGGVGGQMMTTHCCLTEGAAPGTEFIDYGYHQDALRDFAATHPEFALHQAARDLKADLQRRYAETTAERQAAKAEAGEPR